MSVSTTASSDVASTSVRVRSPTANSTAAGTAPDSTALVSDTVAATLSGCRAAVSRATSNVNDAPSVTVPDTADTVATGGGGAAFARIVSVAEPTTEPACRTVTVTVSAGSAATSRTAVSVAAAEVSPAVSASVAGASR